MEQLKRIQVDEGITLLRVKKGHRFLIIHIAVDGKELQDGLRFDVEHGEFVRGDILHLTWSQQGALLEAEQKIARSVLSRMRYAEV